MNHAYVHGYDDKEHVRLNDQARTLGELLHYDTRYPSGSTVLEAGCGVGAQTVTLARNSPGASITSIDISADSIAQARQRVETCGITNVAFRQADLYSLDFRPESFDHVFLCFVLEHVPDPTRALTLLRDLLKPGGTITVIEGDHGSAYFHPDSDAAQRAIQCQVALQQKTGGDAMIGRKLYPLLAAAGFHSIAVSPRMVYADATRPEIVEGFTRNTFTAMIEGIREKAVREGLTDEATFDRGVLDLYRTAEEDGVFCYTFFKAAGRKACQRTNA